MNDNRGALLVGGANLKPRPVAAADVVAQRKAEARAVLRAGAALVIAGLSAEGITTVDDIYFIERGYEDFDKKLQSLGAQIEKVSSEKEIQKFKLKVS